MLKTKWTCAFLVLGLLVAVQSFAATPSGTMGGDHKQLAMYYEQQAQDMKMKAQQWEFAAEYYEKFPAEILGKMTAAEHIAHCKAIAADFRKAQKDNETLAAKHRELTRTGAGP